jgi:hypothetical protein
VSVFVITPAFAAAESGQHNARHTTSSCHWPQPTLPGRLHGQHAKAEVHRASRAREAHQGQQQQQPHHRTAGVCCMQPIGPIISWLIDIFACNELGIRLHPCWRPVVCLCHCCCCSGMVAAVHLCCFCADSCSSVRCCVFNGLQYTPADKNRTPHQYEPLPPPPPEFVVVSKK